MKYLLSTFLLLVMITCTRAKPELETILEKHFKAVGDHHFLQDHLAWQMNGQVAISAWQMQLGFAWMQYDNKFFFFDQEGQEKGMDFTPPIQQILNQEGAFFLVDESKAGGGKNVMELPEEAAAIMQELATAMLHPLYYFQKMGFKLTLQGEVDYDDERVYQIEVIGLSKHPIQLYLDKKNYLLKGMDFTAFHPQRGTIATKRKILAYAQKNGLSYPANWTDKRPGLSLDFTIEEVIFNKEMDLSIFELEAEKSTLPTLNKEQILALIRSYVQALQEDCPFRESIQKIEQGLQQFWQEGKYDQAMTTKEAARVLSADIIALTGDYHFGIDYNPEVFEALENVEGEDAYGRYDEVKLKEEEKNDFFMHSAQELNSGFYYFKIDQMPRIRHAKPKVDALMREAAKRKGLVIDLRDNTGGAGDFNGYLASYLLPPKTLLYKQVYRRETVSKYTEATTHHLPALQKMPVYILVNPQTVSAGEQLAYLLQNHSRAVVVGEPTFGAAHGSIDLPLQKGLIALVPIAYERHVRTQKDWEGSGVVPDVKQTFADLGELDRFLSEQ